MVNCMENTCATIESYIDNTLALGCTMHHLNSMTGTQIETTSKGLISRSAVYEHHNDMDGSSRQLG